MATVFRCSACNRKLSIATRKAGTQIACPSCKATIFVPDESPASSLPAAPTESAPTKVSSSRSLQAVILAGGVTILLTGLMLALALSVRKSTVPNVEQAKTEPPEKPVPTSTVPPSSPEPTPAAKLPPGFHLPGTSLQAKQPQKPEPTPTSTPNSTPPTPLATQQPEEAPPPHPVAVQPNRPPLPLDHFGNPVGHDVGLGHDGEFKGKKLLFWSGFENAGRVFFHPTNPLWKALEAKGFVVARVFGKFKPEWLKEADQLWILSTGRLDLPEGITPDILEAAVSLLPADAVPSGFTLEEYRFIVRATLDVAVGPTHPLDEKAYKAIEEFVKAGKGVCLLADDEPFTVEADELARRLFGARVRGNYLADKVAHVRGRGLTPAEIRKFGGQYEVDAHPLLTGVNFLFEGITVSNISKSDKLEVALKASDGQALIAVTKVPGQRVVIDCGFTRYCHGPTERTSYILKTAGTIRLGQNIAAYLAGKDAPKKP